MKSFDTIIKIFLRSSRKKYYIPAITILNIIPNCEIPSELNYRLPVR